MFLPVTFSGSDESLPDGRLVIEEQTEGRLDLARRSEVKFVIPCGDVARLRQVLQGRCRRVVHQQPVSMVRSVYLDDERLSACRANLDGLGVRRKLRLRWYDSLRPDRELFFEVKWRRGVVTGKHRYRVRSADCLGQMTWRTLLGRLVAALPEEQRVEVYGNCDPVVLVEYRREHYVSADNTIRLTIDDQLAFYQQIGCMGINCGFPKRRDDLVILEGKGPPGTGQRLRELLDPLPLRVSKFSKYVNGCRSLGLVHGGE